MPRSSRQAFDRNRRSRCQCANELPIALITLAIACSGSNSPNGLVDPTSQGGATLLSTRSSGGVTPTGSGTQSGPAGTGGHPGSGGSLYGTGGLNATGGLGSGGAVAGGTRGIGGAAATRLTTGGTASGDTGGRSSTGSAVVTGGTGTAATKGSGGTITSTSSGTVSNAGGSRATGGVSAVGGASGISAAGGATAGSSSTGPCDIYAAAKTPCVAAHSTVRALYGAYDGNLYQVRRASDKTVKDVPVIAPGGFADISVQDSFCQGTTCTISVIYDQSPQKNHLAKSPPVYWLKSGGNEANAANAQIKVSGHTVHGIYGGSNVAYRNNATKGVATGDQAEAMYMVVDGKRYNDQCCFDYGNAETSGNDDGNGTMEAVYFGSDITWGGKGEGSGPWVAADLENGVYKGDKGGWQSQSVYTAGAKSVAANFATVMLKGPSGNHFGLKAGSAQSGTLTTMWDGVRPSNGYSPKKLQGAIILGTGGDGSPSGIGTFFEGAMTSGNPPDATDDLVQANIVAAGYGR